MLITMKYLYLPVCVAAAVFAAYMSGMRLGTARCRATVATDVVANRNAIINKMENINAETNKTGVADIRMWLRTKYTIAE